MTNTGSDCSGLNGDPQRYQGPMNVAYIARIAEKTKDEQACILMS